MKYSWAVVWFASASCSPPSPPVAEATVVAAAPEPQPELRTAAPEAVPAVQAKKEESPAPTFPFPDDTAGKQLPRVVTPRAPVPAPVVKFGTAPKLRTIPAKIVEPESVVRVIHTPPALLPEKPVDMAPRAPAERIPLDVGLGASGVPARPVFLESRGITTNARDGKQPPELAPLGRQLPDRASLDDPTSEPGNAVVVSRTPMPVLVVAGFLKVSLPDPFELAEQMKPKVPATAEPSPMPVPVNPQRVK